MPDRKKIPERVDLGRLDGLTAAANADSRGERHHPGNM